MKIILDWTKDVYTIEKELKKQLRRKSTTWKDMQELTEDINKKAEETARSLQILQKSIEGAPESLILAAQIKKERNKQVAYTSVLATLVHYMSKVALKGTEKRTV